MTEKIMVVASRNRKKAVEMMELLKDLGWRVLSMDEAGTDIEIEEDGLSFEENSYKKAFQVMKATGKTAIADDFGGWRFMPWEADRACFPPGFRGKAPLMKAIT